MSATSGLLPPLILELRAKVGELQTGLKEAKGDIDKFATSTEGSSSRATRAIHGVATVGKALLLGIGGAAIAVGGETIHMADAFEISHARLTTAIANTHQSMTNWLPIIDATDRRMTLLGYSNTDTQDAMSRFVTAGLSQKQVIDATNLSANIAAARGIDLASATLMVTKAYQGNSGALRRMGIDLPVVSGNAMAQANAQKAVAKAQEAVNAVLNKYPDAAAAGSKGHAQYLAATQKVNDAELKLHETQSASAQIVAALSDRYKNQATNASETFAGKLRTLKAETTNVGSSIGLWLIPKVERLVSITQTVIGWLQKHATVAKILGGIIGTVLVGAILVYIGTLAVAGVKSAIAFGEDLLAGWRWVTTKGMQYAAAEGRFILFGAQQIAIATGNGIKFLAVEVASGAKWVATKLLTFATVSGGAIVSAATTAAAWIAANAAMILASGGILLAIGALVVGALWLSKHWQRVWDDIKNWVKDGWAWIKKHMDMILLAMGPVGLFIMVLRDHWRTVWADIKRVVEDVWHFLEPIFAKIGEGIHAITGVVGAIGHGIGGAVSGIGHMLGFAEGGPVPGALGAPSLAVVHGGEYVLSSDMRAGRAPATGAMSGATGTPAAVGGHSNTVNVNVTTNADPRQIASEVGWQLRLAS